MMVPVRPEPNELEAKKIRKETTACLSTFTSCIAALKGWHRSYVENRQADLRLWADSVGALADDKRSLDKRLSGREGDIFIVTSLLEMLAKFLEGYELAVIQSEDTEQLQAARDGIDGITDNLAWVGSAIRRSGTRSRLQRADSCYDRDISGRDREQHAQLQAHLICVIKSKHITANAEDDEYPASSKTASSNTYMERLARVNITKVQTRLVEANLRRWHRFRYAQRYCDVLRASPPVEQIFTSDSLPEHEPTARPEVVDMPRPRIPSEVLRNDKEYDAPHVPASEPATVSGIASDFRGLGAGRAERMTTARSRISTISGATRFPNPRKAQPDRKTALCPCCCQAIPSSEVEDQELWT